MPHGLQEADSAHARRVGGVLRFVEGNSDVGLGRQVVDLVRLDLREQRDEPGPVAQVAVVEEELGFRIVRIHVEVIDPGRVECRRPADEAVDLVSLLEEKFRQVRTVLAGNTGNKRAFSHKLPRSLER